EQVDVLRHGKQRVLDVGIGEGYGIFATALIAFNQHHEFAKDLAQVAAVDLVDDEDVGSAEVGAGTVAEVKKEAVPTMKATFFAGAVALDEVLVGIRLMELHHRDTGAVLLAQKGVGETAGQEGLADTWRPLKQDILLAPKSRKNCLKLIVR